jgi:hypothetical protein
MFLEGLPKSILPRRGVVKIWPPGSDLYREIKNENKAFSIKTLVLHFVWFLYISNIRVERTQGQVLSSLEQHQVSFLLVLALLDDAMDIENSDFVNDSDDGVDVGDDIDELCAVTQSVINNNVALLYYFRFHEYEQHQFRHQQAVERILFPPEQSIYQGKPKLNFDMVRRPSFASKGTTLESLVI